MITDYDFLSTFYQIGKNKLYYPPEITPHHLSFTVSRSCGRLSYKVSDERYFLNIA